MIPSTHNITSDKRRTHCCMCVLIKIQLISVVFNKWKRLQTFIKLEKSEYKTAVLSGLLSLTVHS